MFVLLFDFKVPLEEVQRLLPEHRAHLAKGYEAGYFLVSGRRNPQVGGLVVAAGPREEIEKLAADDPWVVEGVADYNLIEFHPTGIADDVKPQLAQRGVEI